MAVLLLAIQLLFLSLPGIQQDEALFLRPFLQGDSAEYSLTFGASRVPVMLMDYVGGLKTWLYVPVFRMWTPGIWSIRLPVCLLGLGTVLLLARLVLQVADSRVALGSAVLLATDASFVFTNEFDWGPVSLLLAGTLGFLSLLGRFMRTGAITSLAAGFLLAGVMLWYKAVFAFPLAGMAIAWVAVFPRLVLQRATTRNIAVAAGAFLIGAGPLLLFNMRTSGATLKASSYIAHTTAGEKLMMLRLTLNGKAMEHYMFRSAPDEVLPLQGAPLGDLVMSWYRDSRLGPGSLLPLGLLVSAAALPFIRHSRLWAPVAFAWIAGISTEALFVASGTGGAGPHHTVLLFPAPQFIVAATLSALAERGSFRLLLPGAVGLIAISNLVLLANYYRAGLSNGFSVFWTDATRPLGAALRDEHKPAAFLDWGIEAPARIESGDTIQAVDPSPARAGVLYVTHAEGYLLSESETHRVPADAFSRGLVVSRENSIRDSHGRAVFRVFSFDASPGSSAHRPE